MAEELPDQESRTEPPSPRRREQAQEEGRFAHSAELSTGLVLIAGIGGLFLLAHTLGGGFLRQTRLDLSYLPFSDLTPADVQQLCASKFGQAVTIGGALIGLLFVASLAVNFGQAGLTLNPGRLAIDWERISPFQFDRVFGWDKLVRGLVLFLKVVAVGAAAWWVLRQHGHEVTHVGDGSLAAAVGTAWALIIRVALTLAGTLLVIGVADYGYQSWRFERSLYMTKQELKEEHKREQGDPQIRARVRKMQRENARRKMFHNVPRATVVVTNPTHLAVALQYETGMTAPKVIAKGAGHVAKRIAAIARQHSVPVVERKSLAQALFKTVKIDQEIPIGMYLVVAELMAYVYRVRAGATQESGA